MGRTEILDAAEPGELGGTFAGNPVACAAALSVIDVMEEEDLCNKAERIGHKLESVFKIYQDKYSFVGDVRRLGAMVAFEVVKGDKENTPDKALTGQIAKYANDHGLILLSAGIYGNVIRFLMPLVITDEELNKGLDILDDALEKAGEV